MGAVPELPMSGAPKLRQFRSWEEASIAGNGDKALPRSGSNLVDDRTANVKRATFFVAVALIIVFANHLTLRKNASDENRGAAFPPGVSISVRHRVDGDVQSSMFFRPDNMGRHSIFYAASAGTSTPFAEIVARASGSSRWMTPSGVPVDQNTPCDGRRDKAVTWTEMPPEGWVDGEFQDAEDFPGEQAYAIFAKPPLEGKVGRVFSKAYGAKGK